MTRKWITKDMNQQLARTRIALLIHGFFLVNTCSLIACDTGIYAIIFVEIISTLKAIKSYFKRSYDKHNITLVVISYEIYQTPRRLFDKFHMK